MVRHCTENGQRGDTFGRPFLESNPTNRLERERGETDNVRKKSELRDLNVSNAHKVRSGQPFGRIVIWPLPRTPVCPFVQNV